MKRPLSLFAYIVNILTIFFEVFIISFLVNFILALLTAFESTDTFKVWLILVPIVIFGIITFIVNIIASTSWNKSVEVYKKKKGIIKTSIVLNFIFAILLAVQMIMGGFSIVNVIVLAIITICTVLLIIDMANEKKRIVNSGLTVASQEISEN